MKPNLHPQNYRAVLFYDSGAQHGWIIRSCAPTQQTIVWTDGCEYPVMMLDTSSASHPAYTGKQRNVNSEGRASRFNHRYSNIIHKLKSGS
ncbi:type B 50S ribosomal protein L31 [Paralysiella testudinis]|uniref:Large ribosomal subunit protein bL31B n=1 Tax=Paralysiella testudinis TaxID=2809020 RepID=A0A892ZNC4_9NEIS|nr:type B 50S ribosomal protein L31 [Paralysiella testudinis]QRQ83196.1 type B 50S ribosomal protein L31 [Paralysiella testudinis]